MGYPSIHPTGTLIYDKERAYNGYTIFPTPGGALLIDMNGREVNRWAGLGGFPNKLLPGGQVFGTSGARGGAAAYQDQLDLLQVELGRQYCVEVGPYRTRRRRGQRPHLAGASAPRLPA